VSDEKIKSFRKGQAIHRPEGWIKSYRAKVAHLVEGRMNVNSYAAFDILLHIVGWDKKKPDFGRIERNVSRLQREWFPFWSRPTVIKQIQALHDGGYIIDDGEWLTIPNFEKYQSQSVTHVTGGVTAVTESVTRVTESVTAVTVDRPQTRSQSESCEPKERRKKKDINTPLPPKGERRDPLTGWEQFWSAYPKKVGKEPAKRKWRTLAPNDKLIAVILEALERHKRSEQWIKNGGQFIPMASTWLNQRRWEDELTLPKVAGGSIPHNLPML